MFWRMIEPVIKPLGFDWKMGVGLVSAVAAKEVLVSTLGTIYHVGDVGEDSTSLQEALQNESKLYTFGCIFSNGVYANSTSPCLAALAVMKRETNSWKWAGFTFVYSTTLAWIVTFSVYQIGLLLGY